MEGSTFSQTELFGTRSRMRDRPPVWFAQGTGIAPSQLRRTSSRRHTCILKESRSLRNSIRFSKYPSRNGSRVRIPARSLMDRCREHGSQELRIEEHEKRDLQHLRLAPRSKGTPKRSLRVLLNPGKFESRPLGPTIYFQIVSVGKKVQ